MRAPPLADQQARGRMIYRFKNLNSKSEYRNSKQIRNPNVQMAKMTLMCHPEVNLKDLAKEEEILRFAQNESKAFNFE